MLAVVTHDNSDFRITAKRTSRSATRWRCRDIKKGDTIWKYGQDIGIARPTSRRASTHVHNIKTKRW